MCWAHSNGKSATSKLFQPKCSWQEQGWWSKTGVVHSPVNSMVPFTLWQAQPMDPSTLPVISFRVTHSQHHENVHFSKMPRGFIAIGGIQHIIQTHLPSLVWKQTEIEGHRRHDISEISLSSSCLQEPFGSGECYHIAKIKTTPAAWIWGVGRGGCQLSYLLNETEIWSMSIQGFKVYKDWCIFVILSFVVSSSSFFVMLHYLWFWDIKFIQLCKVVPRKGNFL